MPLNREQQAFIKRCQALFNKRIEIQIEIERLQKVLNQLNKEDERNTKLLGKYGLKDLVLVYTKGKDSKDDKKIFNDLKKEGYIMAE